MTYQLPDGTSRAAIVVSPERVIVIVGGCRHGREEKKRKEKKRKEKKRKEKKSTKPS